MCMRLMERAVLCFGKDLKAAMRVVSTCEVSRWRTAEVWLVRRLVPTQPVAPTMS